MNNLLKKFKIAIFSMILLGSTPHSFAQANSSLANKTGEKIGRSIAAAAETALQNRKNAISENTQSYNLLNLKINGISDYEIVKFIYAGSIIIPVLISDKLSIIYYNPFMDVAILSMNDEYCMEKCEVLAFLGEEIRNEKANYMPKWLGKEKFLDDIIGNTKGIIDKYGNFDFKKIVNNDLLTQRILRMASNVYIGDGVCSIKGLDFAKIHSLSGFDKIKYENNTEKNYLVPTAFFAPTNGTGLATFSSFSVPGVFVIVSVKSDCSVGSGFGFDLNRSMN